MSWFSEFFAKLFGQKTASSTQQHTKAHKKTSANQHTTTKQAYQQHTLGFLLQHSPPLTAAMHHYDLNNPPRLNSDICSHLTMHIHKIPPMPEIWHQIQKILQQADASSSDLGQCVAQDPVLTAQILKVCNSSAYASAESAEVHNVPLAIARLGLDATSSIIFQSLAPQLGGNAQRKKEIRHIWFHAQGIAMLSRILAEPSTSTSRNTATLNGMLHDIGKLVILHIASDQQLDQLNHEIVQGMPALMAEHKVLAYTHIDAGMMLALHWKLPKQIQHSISLHHHADMMKIRDISQEQQHAMLILHTAHLLLQYQFTANSNDKPTSIWQSSRRTCLHDILPLVQQSMLIPLESEVFYNQCATAIERLQQSFPDLFETPLHEHMQNK